MVLNADQSLYGTVTDGDIRRGILRGLSVDDSVEEIVNTSPVTASSDSTDEAIQRLMTDKDHRYIPVVDCNGLVERIASLNNYLISSPKENLVFLMAGGFGKRLRPFTDEIPKPLLNVGNKPMLENILETFIRHGFSNFVISLHYKAKMIRDHFGDGSKWNVKIQYTEEKKPLGTAGAVGLLPELPTEPVIIMNGDILTKVNFESLLEFHKLHKSNATMCIREHQLKVPYGTVEVDSNKVTKLVEKPNFSFFANAGIYILNPAVVSLIEKGLTKDMPDLLNQLLADGKKVTAFPIHEYWMDMGSKNEFEQAQIDYVKFF